MDVCTYFSPLLHQPHPELDTPTFEKTQKKYRTKDRSSTYSAVSSTFSDSTLVVRRPTKVTTAYSTPLGSKDDGKNLSKNSEAWKADNSTDKCTLCIMPFNFWKRKHHCRRCGDIFCANCTSKSLLNLQRYCRPCLRIREQYLVENAVTHRTKQSNQAPPTSRHRRTLSTKLSPRSSDKSNPPPSPYFDPIGDDSKSANVHQVFGIHLLDLLKKENNEEGVPNIIEDCINFLSNYYPTEGLFRISGDAKNVKKIISDYNQGIKVEFIDLACPHTVAVVLKKFIFELPDDKLPFPDDLENMTEESITQSISKFSKGMQRFWKRLFGMLQEVSSHSQVNKMTAFNLAIVFAPNFAPDTVSVKCIEYSTKVIEFIILHYSSIFPSSPASPSISLPSSLASPRTASSLPSASPLASSSHSVSTHLSPFTSPRASTSSPVESPRAPASAPTQLSPFTSPRASTSSHVESPRASDSSCGEDSCSD